MTVASSTLQSEPCNHYKMGDKDVWRATPELQGALARLPDTYQVCGYKLAGRRCLVNRTLP
jgi:hypothetical protein